MGFSQSVILSARLSMRTFETKTNIIKSTHFKTSFEIFARDMELKSTSGTFGIEWYKRPGLWPYGLNS